MIRSLLAAFALIVVQSVLGQPQPRSVPAAIEARTEAPTPDAVQQGLKEFYRKCARPDGSFQPGIDPGYRGMSDAAYSDLAAVTYAVTVHKTFGWKLPFEEKTVEFLLARQRPSGEFFNVDGTVDPNSPEGRVYNTTQGLVALHALGKKPRFDPLPVFEAILKEDYKQLPAYSTSFFPLAYLCAGKPIPEKADRGIRALMIQDETGYLNNHVAATFHASHYFRLVEEETPRAREMVARILRDQKPDGGWFRNMPARDRHATFDAVFTLRHESQGNPECAKAIAKAAAWALSCRNSDGGFGHFPGSQSDADAIYFQVGTLVMAEVLKPADPLPSNPHLLSWGHLMPLVKQRKRAAGLSITLPDWVAGVAFNQSGDRFAVACADRTACIRDAATGRILATCKDHEDVVSAVQFHPKSPVLATASFDHTAGLWEAKTGQLLHRLRGHRGSVLSVGFSPDGATLATGGIDGDVRLWDPSTGKLKNTLSGHKSWVNSIAYSPNGEWLASASSDGTVVVWSAKTGTPIHKIEAGKAEVRSIAVSPAGTHLAIGMRFGTVKVLSVADWKQMHVIPGNGDMCAVAFSPSGKFLATTDGDWNRGGTIVVREVATAQTAARLQNTGETLSLAFGAADDVIVAGTADNTVRVWKLALGR